MSNQRYDQCLGIVCQTKGMTCVVPDDVAMGARCDITCGTVLDVAMVAVV